MCSPKKTLILFRALSSSCFRLKLCFSSLPQVFEEFPFSSLATQSETGPPHIYNFYFKLQTGIIFIILTYFSVPSYCCNSGRVLRGSEQWILYVVFINLFIFPRTSCETSDMEGRRDAICFRRLLLRAERGLSSASVLSVQKITLPLASPLYSPFSPTGTARQVMRAECILSLRMTTSSFKS